MNGREEIKSNNEDKQAIGEQIKIVIESLLSKESLERLMNIKMVDLKRYYDIENKLVRMYQNGMNSITDEQFVKLLQSDDKKQSKVVYSRRSGLLDLDDDI